MILVTGGAGFIGTHLCRWLVREGGSNPVRVVDIQDPSQPIDGVEYLRGDIRAREELFEMIRGVRAVYHLAALVSVPLCEKHPEESDETNVNGTRHLIDAVLVEAKRVGSSIPFIYSSSCSVYGDVNPEAGKIQESHSLHPISRYAKQKQASEEMILAAEGLEPAVLRFFNIYGPGQDPSSSYSGVISVFVDRAKKGLDLEVHGDGNQVRDFVFVGDLVEALGRFSQDRFRSSSVFNLGTGTPTSIAELARTVISVTASDSTVLPGAPRSGDIRYSCSDSSLAGRELGWQAKTALRQGIETTMTSTS